MSNKQKILFVIPTLEKGGAERALVTLVNNADTSIFEITVLCLSKKGELLLLLRPEINVIDLKTPNSFIAIFKVRKIVRRLRPDILMSWMGHLNCLFAFFRFLFPTGMSFIGRESSIPTYFIPYYKYPRLFRFMYRYLNQLDGIICQSEAMKNDLIDNFGVDVNKICKINNPVYFNSISQATDNGKEFDFSGSDKKKLLFVGRFSREKRVEILLEVLHMLPDDYELTLIGYGAQLQIIEKLITKYGLESRVSIVTNCSDPSLYYQTSHCILLASAFEGFPNVLIEANYFGCPSVVYQTAGGAKEIINNFNGIYIEKNDSSNLNLFASSIQTICKSTGIYDRNKIAKDTSLKYGIRAIVDLYQQYIIKVSTQ